MLFHEKLIQRRKELGLTQEELSERLSVSRQTVSKWENGECMPDADKFIRLSDILDISLDELAGREVEVQPIVLEAPTLPAKKQNKLLRILAAAALCLVLAAGGFFLGRSTAPKPEPMPGEAAASLPDTLTVGGFYNYHDESNAISFRFNANSSVDGVVYLYRSDWNAGKPLEFPAKYEKGVYTVSGIPSGDYEKVVFVVKSGDQERSAIVVKNLRIDQSGSSFSPVD